MARKHPLTQKDFRYIYDTFKAPVARLDCGRKCAPLNGGSPVCCSTDHAVPVVVKPEWKLLQKRTDLWHGYKPKDKAGRDIVKEAGTSCKAIECKGAAFCERDNRTLACRAFPFFPYVSREKEVIGLATYWDFEDRCWVISNLRQVTASFVSECLDAHLYLFERDPEEFETYKDYSATMRKAFSRKKRPIIILTREGQFLKELPKKGGVKPARDKDVKPLGPYKSEKAWKKAVREA